MTMTRIQAIEILIREAQRERLTKVGHGRVRDACKVLGLDTGETAAVEILLEYRAPTEAERKL
jgi:hypothetical protein